MARSNIFAKNSTCRIYKPFYIVVLALIISNKKFANIFIKFFPSTFIISLLLIMQPDFGKLY